MSRSVSLPMYDFAELGAATRALSDAVAKAARDLGDDVQVSEPDSSNHAALMALWGGNEMYLSQSCGQPYIEELHDRVDVLGTFKWHGVSDSMGRYRSVIVVRDGLGADQVGDLRGVQPTISNPQSLSGWCSLGVALSEVASDEKFVLPYIVSGSHVASLQLLQDQVADVASIDSATYKILSRIRPALVRGLRVIGNGLLVPATPIIVSKVRGADLDKLRSAMIEIVSDLRFADHLKPIGIVGFVNLEGADYEIVRDLSAVAERVLPRNG